MLESVVRFIPKTVKFRKLHTHIVSAFGLLLLVVQVAVLVLINSVLSNSTHDEIRSNLKTGERVFSQLREDNTRQLIQSARILSSDFAFRETIASADKETIVSALSNHGTRINSDLMMLVGTDNVLIADTLAVSRAGASFSFPDLIKLAQAKGEANAFVTVGQDLYQVVVVPVLAPLPIAWLALGFKIDDSFARNLNSLTSLDVSFLAKTKSADTWNVLATTLPRILSRELARSISSSLATRSSDIASLRIADDDYLSLSSRLDSGGDTIVIAVLQRSYQQALQTLRHLQTILLILSAVALITALLASDRIARSITRPVQALSSLATDIQRGDYSKSAATDRIDEIGNLALSFNNMKDGLAAREARITDLAYRDQLTGLPNRRLFNDRLEQCIGTAHRNGQTFSLLMMDLDRFKEVNDILGHHIGDLLLQQIAELLQSCVKRDSDTVARLGGDEFALLLPGNDAKGATAVAQKLLEVLEQPLLLEGQRVVVSSSIGLVTCPDQGDEVNALLRRVELAMYVAKRNNSGYVLFDPSFEAQDEQYLSLMAELRHAVEHDELLLYYQPKVEMASNTITQVEALVRWKHPQRGLVPPDLFIPYAENTGYIKAITCWVIEEALRQRQLWEEQHRPLTISINISARDLLNVELPELFSGLMKSYGAEPHWLSLEITESAIMGNPARAMGILDRLHAMGLHLSIDDFGTGYSSLAYLKKLPVSEIKIDQSFVTHMKDDKNDATIVRSTIDLGHNMGLVVVAEGIEDEGAWTMLRKMGCDLAQGYYISRPMAAADLFPWADQSPWKIVGKT